MWLTREVLDSGHMVDSELDVDDEIIINNAVISFGPGSHASVSARLVGVLTTSVELTILMLDSIDVVVGKFGTLVCEAVLVCDTFLKRRCMDLVSYRLVVDRVADACVLNLESPVLIEVQIIAA